MGYEAHRERVTSDENISFRLNLFRKFCLPSLCRMHDSIKMGNNKTQFTVFIVTSELLSDQSKSAILQECSAHSFIQVDFQNEIEANIKRPLMRQLKKFKEKTLFVTLRMDDDDAISNDFYTQLQPYLSEQFSGYALSFGLGYAMIVDNEAEIIGFYPLYKPKIAIGLAYISVFNPENGLNKYNTVYCLSAHMKVDTRVPTIIDSRNHSYLRTVHSYSDLYSDNDRLKSASEAIDKNITLDKIKERFSL